MKVLFLGDVYGKPGRHIVIEHLPALRQELKVDFCIANGENVAHGRGISEKTAYPLFQAGVDVFTSGNHLWDKKEVLDYLPTENRILKPLNYSSQALGNTIYYTRLNEGEIAVLCLVGQAFMGPANSPIQAIEAVLAEIRMRAGMIIVDIHAEATAEKRALGFYLDGKVSAVIGTHTHIQTADDEILPQGTAYITDVGMTGPHDSVIGIRKELILQKLITGMPVQYEVAETGLQINAVLVEIDANTGRAVSIIRIKRTVECLKD
ncbi:MAG: TIGR00282 family metallophosphoesterase [Candidatus Cloacimonetes bacterium]|nr:TIGR00282 family metallophosphoesterase [Candidatus Cloacimonadota bacterium]